MRDLKLTERGSDKKRLERLSVFLPIIFCFICGVLLLCFGETAVKITAYVIAAVMLVLGAWAVLIYIRSSELERIRQSNLAIGLVLVVGGVMLAIYPDYLDEFLPFIWGLALLFGGFQKIQYAFDEKTVKVEKWWIMLILAAVSIVLGGFVLLKPAFLEDSKYLVMGILLVLEAILDLSVYFLLKNALKKMGIDIHSDPQATVQVKADRKPAVQPAAAPEAAAEAAEEAAEEAAPEAAQEDAEETQEEE